MKLIKINCEHYIIVDDLEITQACYVYKNHENVHGKGIFYLPADTDFVAFNKEAKDVSVITHSTQPLDNRGYWASCITHMPLQEVKELIGEVDVEKKADKIWQLNTGGKEVCVHNGDWTLGFKAGYNQCLEDNKEKKYTEEDLKKIFIHGKQFGLTVAGAIRNGGDKPNQDEWFNESIQSLQPKTQWDIEFIDGKLKLK